jgi:glyoxylase-like metal-dependent hydrolase (beta-lactamase superfamily II)
VLRQVAEGVLIHESEFCQSNAVVVHGRGGVLLIDPGVHGYEMAALANDLRELGQPVVAGFSTHPHWDHLLWHARLGAAPRYGTARCAATVRDWLSDARGKARIAEWIPPDIAEQVPLDLLASLLVCPPKLRGFLGMALKSGLSSIKRMPGPCGAVDRGTRGSRRRRHAF